MKMLVEKTVGRNDDQFQINAICNIFRIVSPRNATSAAITKLVQEITPLKNLDEKLDHVISKFPVLRNSAEYYKAASLCALDRLKTISNYEWDYTKKVRAETTLLRPVAMAVKSSDDYGLSKVSIHSCFILNKLHPLEFSVYQDVSCDTELCTGVNQTFNELSYSSVAVSVKLNDVLAFLSTERSVHTVSCPVVA
ncbi:hypothetical protein L798_12467 [Zootermopsis nevadensis]|uniref:Uncharacterized protein n=1 Tax=Zootermopsis nevadensis TaxID=136037 RepID=A0A067R686_ZOONE|nr:hypothetical protein L798_12467 [Zootermopsis nevadensis]